MNIIRFLIGAAACIMVFYFARRHYKGEDSYARSLSDGQRQYLRKKIVPLELLLNISCMISYGFMVTKGEIPLPLSILLLSTIVFLCIRFHKMKSVE